MLCVRLLTIYNVIFSFSCSIFVDLLLFVLSVFEFFLALARVNPSRMT